MESIRSPRFGQLTQVATDTLKRFREPSSAAPEVTGLLCQWFDSEWGTYWKVDQNAERLRPIFTWNADLASAEKLQNDTKSMSLGLNEGTPGQVWKTGIPVCTHSLVQGMCLPRSLDATALGLKGGIWFPIRTKTRTFAIIELLGQHYWSYEQKFLDELVLLGFALGSVCANQNKEVDSP